MAIYKPSKDRNKIIEDLLKDLDPATRELAKRILENMIREELTENKIMESRRIIENVKKRKTIM